MMEKSITKEEIAKAKESISNVRDKMNIFFTSKIWSKLAPVITIIYGYRKRDTIDLVEFVDNTISTISKLYYKIGYSIDYDTIKLIFGDIIVSYYYNMAKIDVFEGYYFDQHSFDAINNFIESLDDEDIKTLDPFFDKLMDITEK